MNVIIGKAYGSAYVAMNSKSIGADMVYAWPNAEIGMMDAAAAVKIMYAEEISASDKAAALISEKAAEYEALQSSAAAAAGRGYVTILSGRRDETARKLPHSRCYLRKERDVHPGSMAQSKAR